MQRFQACSELFAVVLGSTKVSIALKIPKQWCCYMGTWVTHWNEANFSASRSAFEGVTAKSIVSL